MSGEDRSSESVAKEDHLDKKTLFVRSIPFDATSEQLQDFFSQFSPVKHAVIVTDADNKSRGFGFVSFSQDEDTQTALEKSRKSRFNGRLLIVDIAKRRDRKDRESAGAVQQEMKPIEKRKARLIIRNLPWSVRDPEQLKKIFSKYGAIADAFIPRKAGGRMSGFAFITMKKHSSAERAVKESVGLKIDGREVAVDVAVEKSKWTQYKEENSENDSEEDGSEDENDGDGQEEEEQEIPETGETEDLLNDENADIAEGDEDENDIDLSSDEELSGEEEEEEEGEEKKPRKPLNRKENYTIFVRNIPYDADENSLKEHFEQFGSVKYALPVIDKETQLAKGTAFVSFRDEKGYESCLKNAPNSSEISILISDDVSPLYVYQGRVLSITPAVDRESASRLQERNAIKRSETLGKAPDKRDKRNLFLLNEGRITENSKLASKISASDLEIREKSYKLRVQQLNKNPALHLSMTRLAIRNLPRAVTAKSLKALGRKAVVSFAEEVRKGERQPLSKEEIVRSTKEKLKWSMSDEEVVESKKSKKQGVVRQAKIIMEVKGSGEVGRSRGYGFLEFRDHKTALMGLRWLNAHQVTMGEVLEGLTEEEKKVVQKEAFKKRNLVVEFAIEHANVIQRRREKMTQAKKQAAENANKRKREEEGESDDTKESSVEVHQPEDKKLKKNRKTMHKKGNMNKGPKTKSEGLESAISEDVKRVIAQKRKRRRQHKS